jgi:hypothetical protein
MNLGCLLDIPIAGLDSQRALVDQPAHLAQPFTKLTKKQIDATLRESPHRACGA